MFMRWAGYLSLNRKDVRTMLRKEAEYCTDGWKERNGCEPAEVYIDISQHRTQRRYLNSSSCTLFSSFCLIIAVFESSSSLRDRHDEVPSRSRFPAYGNGMPSLGGEGRLADAGSSC